MGNTSIIRRARLGLALAVAAIAVGVFAAQAGAVTTFYKTGPAAAGPWVQTITPNTCTPTTPSAPDFDIAAQDAMIYTEGEAVGPSPSYPWTAQTISMIPVVGYSADGVHWNSTQERNQYQTGVIDAIFPRELVDVQNLVNAGYHYFTVFETFTWSVGLTPVAGAIDGFGSADFSVDPLGMNSNYGRVSLITNFGALSNAFGFTVGGCYYH